MGQTSYKRLSGRQNFLQRLVLAALASTPVLIEDICAEDMWPGLRPHEVSFLYLLEKVSDDCGVKINETSSKLKFKSGIINYGREASDEDEVMGFFFG